TRLQIPSWTLRDVVSQARISAMRSQTRAWLPSLDLSAPASAQASMLLSGQRSWLRTSLRLSARPRRRSCPSWGGASEKPSWSPAPEGRRSPPSRTSRAEFP
ncbi:OOP, partial [Symbiodinium sp. CCMP2456]